MKWLEIWNIILSVLVTIHLISEYFHYIHEFISQRRKSAILLELKKKIQFIESNCKKCSAKDDGDQAKSEPL